MRLSSLSSRSLPEGAILRGRAAYSSLYRTAEVRGSGMFVRVVAQDAVSKDAVTALLLEFVDGVEWIPLSRLEACL